MIIHFILASLATYRIAHLIATERGPFNVFHVLRTGVYMRWPDKVIFTQPDFKELSWQFDGITCIDCLSFWLAWAAALTLPYDGLVSYAVNALAISAVCVILNHLEFLK